MAKFFEENYLALIQIFITIVVFVIALLKRKPKNVDEFISCLDDVILSIPSLIVEAEKMASISGASGEDKKASVLAHCISDLKSYYGDLSDSEFNVALKSCSEFIEKVLAAPQKKLEVLK